MSFKVHTIESAPAGSKKHLEKAKENFGFLPNIMGVFAESPQALQAYLKLDELMNETSFTPVETQVVLMTISSENDCEYCMAAHSTAAKGTDMNDDVLEALRNKQPLPDKKLEVLRQYTLGIMRNGGHPEEDTIDKFLEVGYAQQQALEIVLATAMKTLSNYTNHLASTPLDEEFAGNAWEAKKAA